jgi:hypothetical protein
MKFSFDGYARSRCVSPKFRFSGRVLGTALLLATAGVQAQPLPAESPPSDEPATPGAPPTAPAADAPPPVEDAAISEEAPVSQGSGLFEASLSGSEDAEAGAEAAAAPPFSLSGYVRGDVFIGKDPGDSEAEAKAAYGEFAVELRTQKETYGDAFAELRLRYGLQGEEKQLFVDLREAYVNAYAGPFDVRLGQQIIVWGRADAFNPTNNLTPNDLRIRSPIEDDRRVGNVGARAFLNFAPLRLEGVYMPFYMPSEIPTVPLPQFVAFGPREDPPPEFDRSLIAARLHLELPSFETSVSYLYGHAPLPGMVLGSYTLGVAPPQILVARKAYDQHVAGFDFSTAFGDVLALRGEAAYRRPLHYERRSYAARPDLQYVLGADRAFGSVSVIAQYMGRYVFDWKREVAPEMTLDPNVLANNDESNRPRFDPEVDAAVNGALRPINQMLFSQLAEIQHLATVRIEWMTLHDTLSLSTLAMANFTTEEWLLAPKIGYRASDAIMATLGAEIIAGPTGTLFGVIDEQLSAGYAELRVSY